MSFGDFSVNFFYSNKLLLLVLDPVNSEILKRNINRLDVWQNGHVAG